MLVVIRGTHICQTVCSNNLHEQHICQIRVKLILLQNTLHLMKKYFCILLSDGNKGITLYGQTH